MEIGGGEMKPSWMCDIEIDKTSRESEEKDFGSNNMG